LTAQNAAPWVSALARPTALASELAYTCETKPKDRAMGMAFDGLVLVAGHSTRMGSDKALLTAPDGSHPMWARQRDVLSAAGATEVYLSARPEQKWTRAADGFAAVLHDALPGCGPLVGITAALERSARTHVAVLAVDLPRMNAEWFAELARECSEGVGAVGRRRETYEPLAAIYSRAVMWMAWEALARGEYALQAVLRRAVAEGAMRVKEIRAEEAGFFENWNEPADV
jgi:molybdopterin-guanine dinucleotide biosynthesis protein A